MTPKAKAEELVEEYLPFTSRWTEGTEFETDIEEAKKCALIDISNTIVEAKRWKVRERNI